MKRIFVFVMMFLLAACSIKPEKVDMGVDFDGTGDAITFTIPSYSSNTKTFAAWVQHDSTSGWQDIIVDGTGLMSYNGSTGNLIITSAYSTTVGLWHYTFAPSTNLYFVAFTMDNSSTSNDPVVYVNGVPVAITENTAPVGTGAAASGTTVNISSSVSSYEFNGKIYDVKVYNRILTPAEVLDLYNSRCKIINDNGLVFHAMLDGAAGLANFDGATLAAGNTFVDRIGGGIGVPAGNPVGVADNVLTLGGQ